MVQQQPSPPHHVIDMDDTDESCNQFDSIAPHPYGVLPGGNVYMGDTTTAAATTTNGEKKKNQTTIRQRCIHSLRDDTLWQLILGYCSGQDLANVVQTCREMYVAGHQPELWRDLVLRDIQQPHFQSKLPMVQPTWKDTFVYRITKQQQQQLDDNTDHNKSNNFQPHDPIPMSGVYSDTYFRTHLCRSFRIPSTWLQPPPPPSSSSRKSMKEKGQVRRVPHESLSTQDFLNTYERPNIPVVIVGAAKSWPAYHKWSSPHYMIQQTTSTSGGNTNNNNNNNTTTQPQLFRATSGAAPFHANFTMESFYQYCCQSTDLEEAPLYLFDRAALQEGHPLANDCLPALHKSCPYFDPATHTTTTTDNHHHDDDEQPPLTDNNNGGHDLFQLLGEGKRPDHTWLIMGSQRSGSSFHFDPNATHAWNAAIVGRKRWIFYPPGVTPPGVHPSPSGDEVAMPISIGEWLLNYGAEHARTGRRRGALECTVEAGDLLFVPHGWWHCVINLDPGMNIAVTHNYVSQSNLPTVLRFLQYKEDQISGCRDRVESIKPEHLHREFTKELQKVHPQWLRDAQQKANQGWTCKAWTDDTNDQHDVDRRRKKKRKHHKSSTKKRKLYNGETTMTGTTTAHGSNSIMARAKVSPNDNGGGGRGEEKKSDNDSVSIAESNGGGGFSFSFL